MDCGHRPEELQHFRQGIHRYDEYRIFGDLSLVLCNFCSCDFSSYDPTYFCITRGQWDSVSRRDLIRVIYPLPEHTWDYVCADCNRRLAWLEFVVRTRELYDTHVA